MTPRQLLSLTLLAALLLGASAYLAFCGTAGGLAGLAYPGEVDDVIPPADSPAEGQGGGDLPLVRLEIEPIARILDVPPRPRCRLLRGAVGDEVVPARATWLAGSAAVSAGRAAGEQLVLFELEGGDRLYRVVRTMDPADVVDVRFEGPFVFEGRVLDPDGAPIGGARVWLAGRPEVRSDAEGRFRVEGVRGRSGLPLVLRAPGYADHFRVVGDPGRQPVPEFHLGAGVDLGVQLAAALPAEGTATVRLRPRGAGDGSLELRHFPFFWPAVEPTRLGADGSCVLSGLPRGQQLEVVVHHPLLVTEPVAVDLRSARQNAVVQGRRGPLVRGRVESSSGVPAGGALITCRRRGGPLVPRAGHGFLLTPSAQLAHVTHAFSHADGSFALVRRDTSGPEWISVLPDDAAGLEREIRGGGEVRAATLTLPAPGPAGERPALRLHTARAVRLVVVRADSTDAAVVVAAGTPYVLPLREAAILDVTVRGRDGERRYPRLAVRDTVDLDLKM